MTSGVAQQPETIDDWITIILKIPRVSYSAWMSVIKIYEGDSARAQYAMF